MALSEAAQQTDALLRIAADKYDALSGYLHHVNCDIDRTEFCSCGLSALKFGLAMDEAIKALAAERASHQAEIAKLRAQMDRAANLYEERIEEMLHDTE